MPKVLEERQGYIESILYKIKCISEEISQKSVSKRQFHNVMQQRIINLANSFNVEVCNVGTRYALHKPGKVCFKITLIQKNLLSLVTSDDNMVTSIIQQQPWASRHSNYPL